MTEDGTNLDLGGPTRVILWVRGFDASVDFYRDTLSLALAYPRGNALFVEGP